MLKIVNKTSTYIHNIGGENRSIPPHKSIEVEIPYTPSLRSLERNGIISVSEVSLREEKVEVLNNEITNVSEEVTENNNEDLQKDGDEEVEAKSTSRRRNKK